jgi:diaminobutyrate-2-oxoglutarate transaminase
MKVQVTECRTEKSVFDSLESNVQSYARAFPGLFHRARGTEVWDVQGCRYLDFLAGAGSLNYGHNNPVMKKVLLAYIEQDAITHSLDLHTTAKARFLEAMREIILEPRGLDYVIQFTGPTGANAVEAALKIARKVTGRTTVISFTNAFHGVSMGALSVTGARYFRTAAGVPLYGSVPMPFDGYFGDDVDTLEYLERMLSDPSSGVDYPAAVIVETVQGEGGLNAARTGWLQRLQTICRRKEILLIVDDIQAGCGRTGYFFSFEPAGLFPDIVTLSKSLSGYGLPMSIVLLKRSLDIWKPGEHNGTFRGNNHAFVTAAAALRHYWRNSSFEEELHRKDIHLGQRLQRMVDRFYPHLLEVRGRGLMQGVRCPDPERAASIAAAAFSRGLIIERSGPWDEVIKCMMPLTTEYSLMDEGLDVLEWAIENEFSTRAKLRRRYPALVQAAHQSNGAGAAKRRAPALSHRGNGRAAVSS